MDILDDDKSLMMFICFDSIRVCNGRIVHAVNSIVLLNPFSFVFFERVSRDGLCENGNAVKQCKLCIEQGLYM